MKKMYLIIPVMILLIVVGVYLVTNGANSEEDVVWPSGMVKAESNLNHNWGDINIKGGDIEHTFVFENNSDESLVIRTAETSCMCTTAYIDIGNEKSSKSFGMRNNPSHWDKVVEPDEYFSVRVVYDPLAHGPDSVGPLQRSVYVTTSAVSDGITTQSNSDVKEGSVIELKVEGNVLYEAEYEKKMSEQPENYSFSQGDFSFEEVEYDFGVVKQSAETVKHEFKFQYLGDEDVTVTGTPTSCACTTAEISKTKLSQGDEGTLTVSFDPNLHEEPEGKFFKTISILTEPKTTLDPEVKIWVEIDLDLGAEAYKLKEYND